LVTESFGRSNQQQEKSKSKSKENENEKRKGKNPDIFNGTSYNKVAAVLQ
jgi:hypothetical protein